MFSTNEQIVCEPALQVCYPAPVRVPFHSRLKFEGETWENTDFNIGGSVTALAGPSGVDSLYRSFSYKAQYNNQIANPPIVDRYTNKSFGGARYNRALTTIIWTVLGTKPFASYVGNPSDTNWSTAYRLTGTKNGLPVYESNYRYDFIWYSVAQGQLGELRIWMQAAGKGINDTAVSKHRLQSSDLSVYGAVFDYSLTPVTEAVKQFTKTPTGSTGTPGYTTDVDSQRQTIPADGLSWVGCTAIVGSGDDQVRYRVKTTTRLDFIIEKNESTLESGWTEIGRVPGGGDPSKNDGSPTGGLASKLLVEFRLISGRLAIRIGDMTTPFYFDESRIGIDGKIIDKIWRCEFEGGGIERFEFGFRPLCFYSEPSFDSDDFQTGFRSTNIGEPDIEPAQELDPLWDLSIDPVFSQLTGPTCQYRLNFYHPADGTYRNINWTYSVAPVRAINLMWLAVLDQRLTLPVLAGPRDVTVTHIFNPDSLTIRSTAVLGFDAQGVKQMPTGEYSTYGEWTINQGLLAIEIGMGRNTPAIWGEPNGGYAGNTVFTGYAKTRDIIRGDGSNNWRYEMHCSDRWIQLDNPRWALPWMDGWHQLYAAMFVSQLHGVSPNEMLFRDFVPSIPFGPGSDLGSPEGLPAYYLPVGDQGTELTRFSGAKGIDIFAKWGQNIGYCQYFNVLGGQNFHKFYLPPGVKRSFFESDVESAFGQIGGGLEGMWDVAVEVDRLSVRSEVVLVGVRAFAPKYKPIIYRQEDGGVVDDPFAFNHLGFHNPSAVLDSQYANDYYAWRASLALMYFLRFPDLTVSWSTWLQQDMFPMDVVMIQSRRTGTQWIRMMITSVLHHTSADGLPFSRITASFVPDFLAG